MNKVFNFDFSRIVLVLSILLISILGLSFFLKSDKQIEFDQIIKKIERIELSNIRIEPNGTIFLDGFDSSSEEKTFNIYFSTFDPVELDRDLTLLSRELGVDKIFLIENSNFFQPSNLRSSSDYLELEVQKLDSDDLVVPKFFPDIPTE